jgi:acyl-CoA synthetase (NDP forming)
LTVSLDKLFTPASVAVVGALDDPSRAGGRLVGYLTEYGYDGTVYMVNPTKDSIAGRPCYPSVSELPEVVDLALITLSARRVPAALREIGETKVGAAVVFATGFAEVGGDGVELQAEMDEVVKTYSTRVLGPNTAGVRSSMIRFFGEQGTNLATVGYRPGSVAVVSQSGALGGYFGSTYLSRVGVGTRYFVDTGNEVDVDVADCLEYLSSDPEVSCIAVMLESCRDGRRLVSAVHLAHERGLPVVVLKVGRSRAGMEAARSHTAALASGMEVLTAELRAGGAVVVEDELQLVDSLRLFASGRRLGGRRVGVVTPSGGFGVLALDVASEQGVEMPPVEPFTQGGEVGLGGSTNPLELAGLATSGTELLEAALIHMASQENLDGVILWHPHRLLRPDQQEPHLSALSKSQEMTGKPHFHCGLVTDDFRSRLVEASLVSIETPTRLMRAIAAASPPGPAAEYERMPTSQFILGQQEGGVRSGEEVRSWLSGVGIDVLSSEPVDTPHRAEEVAKQLGGLVMVKVESVRATHKTELGLVQGPMSPADVGAVVGDYLELPLFGEDPDARVVLQPFEQGIELALGAYFDPLFGPTVMVAQGGIFTEVIRDAAFAAAPVTHTRAGELLRQLRIYPALSGYRGNPADIDAVVVSLVRLSEAVASAEDRFSLDINPLIVRGAGRGAIAVDARIVDYPEPGA